MKRTAAILLVGTWIGLSACCNPVVAGELAGSHPSTFSAMGTIIAKDKAGLTLKRGDYFVASYMTKVIIDDKPFRLVSLPIPCKARIEYTVKKKAQRKVATLIKVLEIPDGAKAGWPKPIPQ